MIVLIGIVVLAVAAVTGVDKYDERSCRGDLRVIRVQPLGDVQQFAACDGFLPW